MDGKPFSIAVALRAIGAQGQVTFWPKSGKLSVGHGDPRIRARVLQLLSPWTQEAAAKPAKKKRTASAIRAPAPGMPLPWQAAPGAGVGLHQMGNQLGWPPAPAAGTAGAGQYPMPSHTAGPSLHVPGVGAGPGAMGTHGGRPGLAGAGAGGVAQHQMRNPAARPSPQAPGVSAGQRQMGNHAGWTALPGAGASVLHQTPSQPAGPPPDTAMAMALGQQVMQLLAASRSGGQGASSTPQ